MGGNTKLFSPKANHGAASNLYFHFASLRIGKDESTQQWFCRLRSIREQLVGTPYAISDIFRAKLLHGAQGHYYTTAKATRIQLTKQSERFTEDIIDQLLQVDAGSHSDDSPLNTPADTTLTGYGPTQSTREVAEAYTVEEDPSQGYQPNGTPDQIPTATTNVTTAPRTVIDSLAARYIRQQRGYGRENATTIVSSINRSPSKMTQPKPIIKPTHRVVCSVYNHDDFFDGNLRVNTAQ
ncbi:uncharacterized protein DFL_008007 [Arthrobotrys flagrans]|uniref:Uncharacterized protein n=1 Tax=Arthrobotrys flagrans TaxID=97331 RepID=A0A436ZY12_ARTFL|nr:hypothetical protein DFL_008007 [Arthrobotrys flagrans]